MAKPAPISDPPEAVGPSRPSPGVLLVYRLLKLAAFVLALPSAVIAGMALIGAVTDNGYARLLGALLVMLAAPLFVADRLLPDHDPARARGLVSDVCAVTWSLVVFVVAGLANGSTRPLLAREGDRLVSAGYGTMATVAYVLAGVRAESAAAPAIGGSASASSSAAGPASAAAPSAVPSGSASASPTASSSAAAPPKPRGDRPGDKTPAELFKEVSPSVVALTAQSARGVEGGGTGFVIDRAGIIATNHHVIDRAALVKVKFQNGAVFEAQELLVDDATLDLALLRIDPAAPRDGGPPFDAAALALANSDDVVVGERAVVIGNPLGLEHTLSDGLVSSRRMWRGRAWIQFSAPIGNGNSGGPVFNLRGEVIGVATASLSAFEHGAAVAQNLNLAVPINELRKLIRSEYPGRRKLGDEAAAGRW